MSFSQLDRWFRSRGCELAENLPAPPELRERKGYYLPLVGDGLSGAVGAAGALVKRVVLTTPALDRQGDIVVPTGVSLKWFRRNPVVLWAHRYDLPPIGSVDVESIKVSERGIEADVHFDAASPMGREVYGLYDRGVMRAWSIGFVPLKWKVIEDADTNRVRGYRVESWELLEISTVPVPANPEALTRQIAEIEARGYDASLAPMMSALKSVAGQSPESPSDAQARLARVERRQSDIEERLRCVEAAKSKPKQTAAPTANVRHQADLAEAVASMIRARLGDVIRTRVQLEFDRRRGGVI